VGDSPFGFLVLDKPAGLTSHSCVARIRRAYGLRRVGHGGTLDPAVTGATTTMVRLETDDEIGPWFEWASVGLDAVEEFGQRVSLRLKDVEIIGERGMAELAAI